MPVLKFGLLLKFFFFFLNLLIIVQRHSIALSNGSFLAHGISFRQFIYLDLGSRYSLTAMIIHIRWSGTCGLFIGWCWPQSMASYCSCTIPSGEKDYLVSLHMQMVKVVSYQFHGCLISLFFFQYSAARPAFYNYIAIMFSMNALALFACALTGNGASFGFW